VGELVSLGFKEIDTCGLVEDKYYLIVDFEKMKFMFVEEIYELDDFSTPGFYLEQLIFNEHTTNWANNSED